MVSIINNAQNLKLRDQLAKYKVIRGVYHSPGLSIFLKRDAPDEIYERRFDIRRGALNTGPQMRPIFGLADLHEIFTAIKQEQDKEGNKTKVLYGWGKEIDLGDWGKARISYVLATKKVGAAEFSLERDPIPLSGLTQKQQMRRATSGMSEALSSGPDRGYYRAWNVCRNDRTKKTFVILRFAGATHEIDGFDRYKQVFSALVRKDDKLVIFFYGTMREARANIGCIKAAVLAESREGKMTALERPRMIYSTPDYKTQYQRVFIAGLNDFLLAEKKEEDYFYLEPKQVDENGGISFAIDCKQDKGGFICLSGYKGHNALYGAVVVSRDQKVAYFWPDARSRESFFHPTAADPGTMPIKQEGHVFAERAGNWRIVFRYASEKWRLKRRSTLELGRYLFAAVGDKRFVREYPVSVWRAKGRPLQKTLLISVRGLVVCFDLTAFSEINGKACLVGRELGGKFKLLEVWPSIQAQQRGGKPLQACFAAFRSDDHSWTNFKVKLDRPSVCAKNGKKYAAMVDRFKKLIYQKKISREELSAILSQDDLLEKHGEALFPLIDDLFVSRKKHDQPLPSVE